MQSSIKSEDEVTIIDVYRLESQEISIDFSDGSSITLTVHDILALRVARNGEQLAIKGAAPDRNPLPKQTRIPTTAIQLNPNDLHEE